MEGGVKVDIYVASTTRPRIRIPNFTTCRYAALGFETPLNFAGYNSARGGGGILGISDPIQIPIKCNNIN